MIIKIWNRDEDKAWIVNDFEGLSFESVNPGGWTVANFTAVRDITITQHDLQPFNPIVIYDDGPIPVWEGYIDLPTRSVGPDERHRGRLFALDE